MSVVMGCSIECIKIKMDLWGDMNTHPEIKKVCFIGAGTIGCWNSLIVAMGGYDVVVYDIDKSMLDSAPDKHQQQLKAASKMGILNAELGAEALSRIRFTSDSKEAVENADLLSESVPEKLDLKRLVHRQFDVICPERTIMTTNTSSLLVSEIEDVVQRRNRFAALHFHLYGRLVDIVGGPETSPDVIVLLKQFVQSIDQTPIVHTTEKDGYLWNSLLILGHKNAIMLVLDGYGTVEDVDRSVMAASNSKTGPFAQLDIVGLDLARDIFQAKFDRSADQDFKRAIAFLDGYVARGEYGIKTGKGFYSYPNPAWQQSNFLKG